MTVTYMLEITEDELSILWAALTILDHNPGLKPDSKAQRDADKAAKSVLSKVERLMVGK